MKKNESDEHLIDRDLVDRDRSGRRAVPAPPPCGCGRRHLQDHPSNFRPTGCPCGCGRWLLPGNPQNPPLVTSTGRRPNNFQLQLWLWLHLLWLHRLWQERILELTSLSLVAEYIRVPSKTYFPMVLSCCLNRPLRTPIWSISGTKSTW